MTSPLFATAPYGPVPCVKDLVGSMCNCSACRRGACYTAAQDLTFWLSLWWAARGSDSARAARPTGRAAIMRQERTVQVRAVLARYLAVTDEELILLADLVGRAGLLAEDAVVLLSDAGLDLPGLHMMADLVSTGLTLTQALDVAEATARISAGAS